MDRMDLDEPLVVVNGDIVLDIDLENVLKYFAAYDGGIVTFESVHPRWSFVRTGADKLVLEAAEKKPISKQATVGLYWFASASLFLRAASDLMLKAGDPDKEFYVCPVYNELILQGGRIATWQIEARNYHNLSDPNGVRNYEEFLNDKRT
jgi:dTDP-glucose pyrophosphorylase